MNDDTIKRSDAIKAIINKPAWHGSDGSWYHGDDIKDALETIPSADRPQDDEFKNFDRGDLIALIEAQKERIGELLADRPQGEWHKGFYDFLWNVINPNEMQKYIEMYEAQPIAVDGAQMKGADDDI